MDSFHPPQPDDPPLLPLTDQQVPAVLDLEASRSRSRTHSEVSETPTIACPEQSRDPPRQIGQEESSSVAPTEFYSAIANALRRVQPQLGDTQDFQFWNTVGKHNLVLWLDYTEEELLTTQSVAIGHKQSPFVYQTKIPIDSATCFFTDFWYDPPALDLAHWLCDSFADVIAPIGFVMLSYMDEWALNATRQSRARKEATLKELKIYAKLFIEAKSAEIKSWLDNDVFDLVDIRKLKPKNFVTSRLVLTVKRDRDGKFQKCKA